MARNLRLILLISGAVVLLACAVARREPDSVTPNTSGLPTTGSPRPSPTDEFADDVNGAIETIEAYWTEQFQRDGLTFQPVRRITPYHGRTQDVRCGGQSIGPNNAAYCSAGDFIAFDQDFMRAYFNRIGDAFVYFVLGHEYGHAVQARLRLRFQLSVETELNADCLSGAYLGDSVRSGRLLLEDGDVDELRNGLEAVADPTDDWFAEDAHGTAEQRVDAFSKGYNNSLKACLEE